jgi:Ran GTPase-activating protein (RanGAP) involved in mRNA processing and transport
MQISSNLQQLEQFTNTFSKKFSNKFSNNFRTNFQDRGIVELQGWTVAVEEGGDTCAELNGGDFVLDGIGELVKPEFS